MEEKILKEDKNNNLNSVIYRCEKHGNELNICLSCDKKLCKVCVFEDKTELKHLKDHYDNIKDLIPTNKEYFSKLNYEEGYKIFNEIIKTELQKADVLIDSTFNKLSNSEILIKNKYKMIVNNIYKYLIDKYYKLIKKINSLNKNITNSKDMFAITKKYLNKLNNMFENEEYIINILNNVKQNIIKEFDNCKVNDLLNEDILYFIGKYGENLRFNNLKNDVKLTDNKILKDFNIYYSEEIIEREFTATLKINEPDKLKRNDIIFIVGLINKNSYIFTNNNNINENYNNETSKLYKDCYLLKSNGIVYNQPNKSIYNNNINFKNYENSEYIYIQRTDDNELYFSFDCQNKMLKVFDNVEGDMKIIIFISSRSSKNDEVNLIEINKL